MKVMYVQGNFALSALKLTMKKVLATVTTANNGFVLFVKESVSALDVWGKTLWLSSKLTL